MALLSDLCVRTERKKLVRLVISNGMVEAKIELLRPYIIIMRDVSRDHF